MLLRVCLQLSVSFATDTRLRDVVGKIVVFFAVFLVRVFHIKVLHRWLRWVSRCLLEELSGAIYNQVMSKTFNMSYKIAH